MSKDLSPIIKMLHGLNYQLNVPLAPFTTLKIGGPANILVTATTEQEVMQVLQATAQTKTPLFILGGGSNLLISDEGFKGLVLQLSGELATITTNPAENTIIVGAGASFPKLTNTAIKMGWECALGFLGTPGQVGGALKMNAGTPLGEIGEVVHEVHAVTAQGLKHFKKDEIEFSYRNTSFPNDIILSKTILRYNNPQPDQVENYLAKAQELTSKRKATQPKMRSAGSTFKNPPGDYAGRLIEATGLKGRKINDAEVSTTHANFIVNTGKASAKDIFELSQIVRQEVYEKHHIWLEYEVKLIGEHKKTKA